MTQPALWNALSPVILTTAVFVGTLWTAPPNALGQEVKPPEEKKKWESVAAAGLTLTRGNSHNFLATASLNATRKWTKDELLLGIGGGYGETTERGPGPDETTKTEDYLKAFGQWNHLFTERLYSGLRLDAVHDDIADLDYRLILSPMVGYYFIKTPATFLSGEAGPSFIYEKQGGDETGYVGARLAERFEHKFKNGAKLWQTLEWIPQVDEVENWIANFEAGISAPVAKGLNVRVVAQDTYDNQPADDRLKNDFKLIAGLDYRF